MIRRKLARFLAGRYGAVRGVDGLGWFLFAIFAVASIIGGFIGNSFVRWIFSIVSFAAIAFYFYRFLSRNIYSRQKENAAFMKIWKKIPAFFKLQKNRWKDRKTHVYKKCPHCKAILRLPRKKGKNSVICPGCRERFFVRNLF